MAENKKSVTPDTEKTTYAARARGINRASTSSYSEASGGARPKIRKENTTEGNKYNDIIAPQGSSDSAGNGAFFSNLPLQFGNLNMSTSSEYIGGQNEDNEANQNEDIDNKMSVFHNNNSRIYAINTEVEEEMRRKSAARSEKENVHNNPEVNRNSQSFYSNTDDQQTPRHSPMTEYSIKKSNYNSSDSNFKQNKEMKMEYPKPDSHKFKQFLDRKGGDFVPSFKVGQNNTLTIEQNESQTIRQNFHGFDKFASPKSNSHSMHLIQNNPISPLSNSMNFFQNSSVQTGATAPISPVPNSMNFFPNSSVQRGANAPMSPLPNSMNFLQNSSVQRGATAPMSPLSNSMNFFQNSSVQRGATAPISIAINPNPQTLMHTNQPFSQHSNITSPIIQSSPFSSYSSFPGHQNQVVTAGIATTMPNSLPMTSPYNYQDLVSNSPVQIVHQQSYSNQFQIQKIQQNIRNIKNMLQLQPLIPLQRIQLEQQLGQLQLQLQRLQHEYIVAGQQNLPNQSQLQHHHIPNQLHNREYIVQHLIASQNTHTNASHVNPNNLENNNRLLGNTQTNTRLRSSNLQTNHAKRESSIDKLTSDEMEDRKIIADKRNAAEIGISTEDLHRIRRLLFAPKHVAEIDLNIIRCEQEQKIRSASRTCSNFQSSPTAFVDNTQLPTGNPLNPGFNENLVNPNVSSCPANQYITNTANNNNTINSFENNNPPFEHNESPDCNQFPQNRESNQLQPITQSLKLNNQNNRLDNLINEESNNFPDYLRETRGIQTNRSGRQGQNISPIQDFNDPNPSSTSHHTDNQSMLNFHDEKTRTSVDVPVSKNVATGTNFKKTTQQSNKQKKRKSISKPDSSQHDREGSENQPRHHNRSQLRPGTSQRTSQHGGTQMSQQRQYRSFPIESRNYNPNFTVQEDNQRRNQSSRSYRLPHNRNPHGYNQ